MAAKHPLIVIVGPTASGKTAAAIDIAAQINGEIICADSRTIYTGFDIGTAKPSVEERASIPHWGLDLVEPDESFSVADFKDYANEKIDEIRARGKTPLLVGGTGLYVDSVVFDYRFGDQVDIVRRKELESLSLEQLHEYCQKNNVLLPENIKNKRYVIRAIERAGQVTKRREAPLENTIIVGIATKREILRTRIARRAEQIFKDGVVDEAIILGKKYGWESSAMTGNIYPLIKNYLEGKDSYSDTVDKFSTLDWRLARRQMTWFRRNHFIVWTQSTEVGAYVGSRLANEQIT